ncbi:hypothetical protein GCM10027037_19570 [Mucilaginibacter koreensis]
MKKEEVPQDKGALGRVTKEVVYATDSQGNYTKELSTGWEVKATALDVAWQDIDVRIADARKQVLDGKASPILFFMEARLMDIPTLAAYTGFWQWQVKRHLKTEGFKKLSDQKLNKYAEAFNIKAADFDTLTVNES